MDGHLIAFWAVLRALGPFFYLPRQLDVTDTSVYGPASIRQFWHPEHPGVRSAGDSDGGG